MSNGTAYLEEVGEIVDALTREGLTPVLVGGMALVMLGSRRVTKDFDFLISEKAREQKTLLSLLYHRGFELAAKVNAQGDIVATIDNPVIAGVRLTLDSPASAYFLNRTSGLRIDFLFDFPLPAADVLKNANKKKIKAHYLYVAAKEDLVRLKEMAYASRSSSSDRQDLDFLRTHN